MGASASVKSHYSFCFLTHSMNGLLSVFRPADCTALLQCRYCLFSAKLCFLHLEKATPLVSRIHVRCQAGDWRELESGHCGRGVATRRGAKTIGRIRQI